MRHAIGVLMAAVLASSGFVQGAGANVTSASVSPPTATIPADTSSTVSVTWQAISVPDASGGGGSGATVTSTDGVFRADSSGGTVIGTSTQSLSAVAQGPAGQPGTATFAETVLVPLPVLAQAVQLGAARIVFQRAFGDGPLQPMSGNTAEITLNLIPAVTVSGDPAVANVPAGQSSTVSLSWQVSGAAAGTSVSSADGIFRADGPGGPVLGTNPRSLTATLRAVGGTSAVAVPETVRVPTEVVLRAEQVGAGRIVYQRVFTAVGGAQSTGDVRLELAGPLGGPFGISALQLRFEDGTRQAVVPPGEAVHVIADITHTGSGRLEGQWEVAEPGSTRGVPFFRSLSLERRQLVTAAARVSIRSPALPSADDGVYLVRFRITSPQISVEPPTLRYIVSPAETAFDPQPLTVLSPSSGAAHSSSTRFRWEGLNGAAAYRVEFHEASEDTEPSSGADSRLPAAGSPGPAADNTMTPISGFAVDAAVTDAVLSRLALSHLPSGRHYRWRVLAYDASGRLVGQSELRSLYVADEVDDD
jgi:hypothetical protein